MVHRQQIGRRIPDNLAAEISNPLFCLRNDLRMQLPEKTVGLEVTIVTAGRKSNSLVCTNQAAKAIYVRRSRWHALRFIDYNTGKKAPGPIEPAQALNELLI